MGHTVVVVVGIDRSEETSRRAVEWAVAAALRLDAELHLVHALDFATAGRGRAYQGAVTSSAQVLLSEHAAYARSLATGLTVRTELDDEHPVPALVHASRFAALLVLGTHPVRAVADVLVDSIGYQVASQAHCPVALVPAAERLPGSGVVVGVDGSGYSETALRLAAASADLLREELHVVHVWQVPGAPTSLAYLDQDTLDRLREEAEELVAGAAASLEDQFPGVVVRGHVVRGLPVPVLQRYAEQARLVVVGSRGRHGIARLLLGSVSHALVHRCPCALIVARSRAETSGRGEGAGRMQAAG